MGSYTDEVAHDNAPGARTGPNLAGFSVGVAAPRSLYRVLVGDPKTLSEGSLGRTVTDLVTAGTTAITSAADAKFTAADVGKKITGKNIPISATISAVGSATAATLSIAATGSGTNRARIGGKFMEVSDTMPAGRGELLIAAGDLLTQAVADIIGV